MINNFQQFFSSGSELFFVQIYQRFITTSFANEEHQQRLAMRPPVAYRLAIQQTPKKDQSDPLDYQSHMPVTVAGTLRYDNLTSGVATKGRRVAVTMRHDKGTPERGRTTCPTTEKFLLARWTHLTWCWYSYVENVAKDYNQMWCWFSRRDGFYIIIRAWVMISQVDGEGECKRKS